jgi:transposase-like protein
MDDAPKSVMEAIQYFSNEDNAREYLVSLRWPDGVVCPYCEHKRPSFLQKRRIWKCGSCRKQFSVKVGTVFEDSPLPLAKWLTTAWLVSNCKNGVSSYEIARDLKVTQKSGWFMLHRIREAMQNKSASKLGGEVEVDETFIGGKARNMHRSKRERVITGTGGKDKTIAFGMVERGGEVRTMVCRQPPQAGSPEHCTPKR